MVVVAASAHVERVLDLGLVVAHVVVVEGSEASLTLVLEAIPCPGDDMDMIVPDDRGVRNVHRDGGVRTMGCGDVVVVDQFR